MRRFWSLRLDALGAELARHRPRGETPSADERPATMNEEEEE
ncbi:hypothetical protein ABGB18_46630 [Nonomuraea sp. B12E4]